jgi:uncharacterized protein (DUF362 family)
MSLVTVLKTSPQSLATDVDRAFTSPALAALDPARPTWIKVNGNFNIAYPGSNTSLWFLRALLTVLRDRGFSTVTVVEGDLPEFRAENMAVQTGLQALVDGFRVPFLSYEKLPRDENELPRALAEVQLLNTPVFHTHGNAVISCATKNLFGLLPRDRRKFHGKLSEKLLDLAAQVPCATLVDGTVGLEGESTRRGDPVRCDLLIAGGDLLAIDVIAAKIMGFTPEDIPLLSMAAERSLLPQPVVGGDVGDETLPRTRFKLEVGKIHKLAVGLARLNLDLEKLFALTDPVRVTWHRLNYRRKKARLASGPWRDYDGTPGARLE